MVHVLEQREPSDDVYFMPCWEVSTKEKTAEKNKMHWLSNHTYGWKNGNWMCQSDQLPWNIIFLSWWFVVLIMYILSLLKCLPLALELKTRQVYLGSFGIFYGILYYSMVPTLELLIPYFCVPDSAYGCEGSYKGSIQVSFRSKIVFPTQWYWKLVH